MSASRTAEPLLTAEDLYALPDDDRRYELVEGRLVVSDGDALPGFSATVATLVPEEAG